MSTPQKNNTLTTVKELLYELKIKVNTGTLKECLLSHPSFPSVLSISECLNEWNIENNVFRIPRRDYNADDLLFPFIAHLREKGGRFILVHGLTDGIVTYSNESEKKASLSEKEFLARWDGIALHAEPGAMSGEKDYMKNQIKYFLKDLIFPSFAAILLSVLYFFLSRQSALFPIFPLVLIKILALVISIALLVQSVDMNNPFIQNLCSLAGKKNDCNAILKSEASQLTSLISWSEVGFFYFTGTFLALLLSPSSVVILAWVSILALPYTFYSISYQMRTKKWCILCCSVQVILWLEFIIYYTGNLLNFNIALSPENSIILISCFLAPIAVWGFLKSHFLDSLKLKPLEKQLKTFKYNEELFNKALTSQPKYAVTDELMPIISGNRESETIITIVSNPYCAPCAKAHQTLNEWIKSKNNIQLKTIFTTTNNESDSRTKVAKHLIALNSTVTDNKIEEALNKWYSKRNKYENWAKEYPVIIDEKTDSVVKTQREWCKVADITFTPTILVNGYKLPQPYQLDDLKFLIN
jgi:thiol-disulfide isomerase/thioredoxin